MGRRSGYDHPFRSSDKEREHGLQRTFWDALAACGLDTPKALAKEIGVCERTARKYINDPANITEDAFQRMLESPRLGEYVLCARYGVDMDYARAYAGGKPAFDPEIPDMTKRLIRAFFYLPKGLMVDVLHIVEAASRGAAQNVSEAATCNWIRGKVTGSDLMSEDELPLDASFLPERERRSMAGVPGISTERGLCEWARNGKQPRLGAPFRQLHS